MRKPILVCSIGLCWALSAWAQTAPTYTISTIAGDGTAGFAGDGGPAAQAELYLPYAAVFVGGSLYISDQVNNRARIVTSGTINTIAGSATQGYLGDGSAGNKAQLFDPTGICVDSTGNVYISDSRNEVIRKVTTAGIISTYAGNNILGAGISGDMGTATNAQLNNPAGLAIDSSGNLYIADALNNRIRIVSAAGEINTFAGNLFSDYAGDEGPAVSAELNNPEGVFVDAAGNVYIADTLNNRIRMVTPDGNIHTVAGNGTPGHTGDGGQALEAELYHPEAVAVDTAGNIYIADTFNQCIRMVLTNGKIVTIAGGTQEGYAGDGGPALSATFTFPSGIFVDGQGNVYVTDSGNYVIREMVPSAVTVGPGMPTISPGGVITASAFGASSTLGPGSWIEIYGSNLAADSRLWTGSDFTGVNAPISLDRTEVLIGGEPAFVEYVSPNQVNAQIPSDFPAGTTPLVVRNALGTSAAVNVTVTSLQPEFYAPTQLLIGGKQYIGALDGATFVAPPGSVPGLVTARAHVGDVLTLYGIGFGDTNPLIPAGQVAVQSNSVMTFPQIFIGGIQAAFNYKGLAPGEVGLYQFNIVVPAVASSDLVPVTLVVAGVPGTQVLYTAIQNP